ncbi:unnamed protein product [Mortierella alpina]
MNSLTSNLLQPGSHTASTTAPTTARATAPMPVVKPLSACVRALAIPEILERILSLLHHSTLLRASLVSQQWDRVSLPFMIHSTTWNDANTEPEEPPVTVGRPHLHRVLRCILFHVSASLTRLCVRFEDTQTIDLLVILKYPRLACLHLDNCPLWPFGPQTDASGDPDPFNRLRLIFCSRPCRLINKVPWRSAHSRSRT